MKINIERVLIMVAVVGVMAVAGCSQKSESEISKPAGVGERTGAALDKAAENTADALNTAADKTGEAVKKTAEATKDVAGRVVEKTGEVLEKAGAAAEKTGADLQK